LRDAEGGVSYIIVEITYIQERVMLCFKHYFATVAGFTGLCGSSFNYYPGDKAKKAARIILKE